MNTDSSSGIPSEKRAVLPAWVAKIFYLIRMFWFTELALLIVVLYGLRAGWSTPKQWSDGFFMAGAIQVVIAAITVLATPSEGLEASYVRYVPNGSISETRHQLFLDTLRRRKNGVITFLGAVLTFLIAAVAAWV